MSIAERRGQAATACGISAGSRLAFDGRVASCVRPVAVEDVDQANDVGHLGRFDAARRVETGKQVIAAV